MNGKPEKTNWKTINQALDQVKTIINVGKATMGRHILLIEFTTRQTDCRDSNPFYGMISLGVVLPINFMTFGCLEKWKTFSTETDSLIFHEKKT